MKRAEVVPSRAMFREENFSAGEQKSAMSERLEGEMGRKGLDFRGLHFASGVVTFL